ncbi:MAG: cytochrome b/b6 domain-containing protein [Litoreibacter sp.]|nr:cytochrome b/b6 domain-containing protein [Litoreibacter sp.]
MRSNTLTTYGSVTKTFHWLIAALILTVIPLGVIGNGLADADPIKPVIFSAHKTIGLTIFFLAIFRIIWAIAQPKPGALNAEKKVETFLAYMVHYLLYASLIIIPLSGWIHHAATTGFAPIWWPFGQSLPFVPVDDGVAHTAASLHIKFERVLILAFILHVAGALKHHVIDKDDTLRRMLPGTIEPSTPTIAVHHRAAPIAALAIYAAALGIGGGLGMFKHDTIQAEALAEAQSDWVVQDGTLSITVKQLGSDVEGSFADWTAAITFDETPDPEGRHGSVEVIVSIPSLTLGSVTSQAMGPDFFDAETFATAVFQADIVSRDGEYAAEGTLTIRGQEVPMTLPFELDITDGLATMSATTTINRMDFGIGASSQPGEGSLAFAVTLVVALTAQRS